LFSWVSGNRQGGLARGAGPIACNPLSSRRAKRRGVEAFNVSSARPSRRAPPKSSPCSSRGRPRWSCPRAASRQGRPAGGGAVARGRLARGPLCVAMHGPTPAHGGSSKHPELTTHANTRAPRLPSPTLRPPPVGRLPPGRVQWGAAAPVPAGRQRGSAGTRQSFGPRLAAVTAPSAVTISAAVPD
jgi:hypothetical protein